MQRASAHARVCDHAGAAGARAIAPAHVAFRVINHVGLRIGDFSRLNGWPMRCPVNASPIPSRVSTHDSGASVVRYTFTARDFHSLLFAGFAGALIMVPATPMLLALARATVSATIAAPAVAPQPTCAGFVGNFDVAFSATYDGGPIAAKFSPDNPQDGGNVAGSFIGWEGLDQAGLSETTVDAHISTFPGMIAVITTARPAISRPCPSRGRWQFWAPVSARARLGPAPPQDAANGRVKKSDRFVSTAAVSQRAAAVFVPACLAHSASLGSLS